MMVPTVGISFALCLAPYATGSQPDSLACDTAASEYTASSATLYDALRDISYVLVPILGPKNADLTSNASGDPATAQRLVGSLCPQLNLTGQRVENVINQCSRTSEPYQTSRRDFAPDVYRAGVKLCEQAPAQGYVQHIQTLVPCALSLFERARPSSAADREDRGRVQLLAEEEWTSVQEDPAVSCGFVCGRQCACRRIQIGVPMHATQSKAHIREVCGQKEFDLVMELQERLLNALNCVEFGNYVKDWGWLKVNYQAKKITNSV